MKQTIEVFTFNLRYRKAKKKLSFSEGNDLFELLKKEFVPYVDKDKSGPVNPEEKRTVKIPPAVDGKPQWGYNDNRRCIFGIIESGTYGKKLEIVDKDNPQTVLYTSKDNNAAVIKPFFFLVFIPRKGDTGYIILERTDNEGIFPLFHILFLSFLSEKYNRGNRHEYSMDIRNYLSHEYVENLREGNIKSVRLSLSSMPKDISEKYMLPELDVDTSISIVLSFKGGIRPNHKIAKAIKDHDVLFSSDAVNSLFKGSKRSIITESEVGGVTKERTVYLSEETKEHIRPYYIVDVESNEKGYSLYTSICDAVFDFIDNQQDLKKLNT